MSQSYDTEIFFMLVKDKYSIYICLFTGKKTSNGESFVQTISIEESYLIR